MKGSMRIVGGESACRCRQCSRCSALSFSARSPSLATFACLTCLFEEGRRTGGRKRVGDGRMCVSRTRGCVRETG